VTADREPLRYDIVTGLAPGGARLARASRRALGRIHAPGICRPLKRIGSQKNFRLGNLGVRSALQALQNGSMWAWILSQSGLSKRTSTLARCNDWVTICPPARIPASLQNQCGFSVISIKTVDEKSNGDSPRSRTTIATATGSGALKCSSAPQSQPSLLRITAAKAFLRNRDMSWKARQTPPPPKPNLSRSAR